MADGSPGPQRRHCIGLRSWRPVHTVTAVRNGDPNRAVAFPFFYIEGLDHPAQTTDLNPGIAIHLSIKVWTFAQSVNRNTIGFQIVAPPGQRLCCEEFQQSPHDRRTLKGSAATYSFDFPIAVLQRRNGTSIASRLELMRQLHEPLIC
ncbi:hypothetical protein C1T17_00285 [Sphingobium sp. SCG-1]|nr:hypothetical protein C1T17_00285 [Sphingobium sp. SCG-1]